MLVKKNVNQFIRFGMVGVCNTVIDFLIFWILHTFFDVNKYYAQIVSYCISVLNSYAMNKKFTFKVDEKANAAALLKFFTVNLVSLSASLLVFRLLDGIIVTGYGSKIDALAIKILATFVVTTINFLGSKLWVFK